MSRCLCINCVVAPHLLKKLLESKNQEIRQAALHTLLPTFRLRGERKVRSALAFAAAAAGNSRRTIFDCRNSRNLLAAEMARSEQDAVSTDESVNRAFDKIGITRNFYKEAFDRISIDDQGMRLDGYVHYNGKYNNAFWDGQSMVFGDGDGVLFADFTMSLDVIAHELAHGVTEFTAGLEHHNEPGALNESISDVFGSLVKQWHLGQTAEDADWLIGADVFMPNVNADALRSLKAPGTAYDNAEFGKDPQPDHMRKYVALPDTDECDFGGVHINSGIPNKAFYLAAIEIGGFAWEAPGQIWYDSLKASGPRTNFKEFAETTYFKAEQLYGADSNEQRAVLGAWREVGIRLLGKAVRPRSASMIANERVVPESPSLAALTKHIASLSTQMTALTKEVNFLKGKK